MRVFLAGIMQGSHLGAVLHHQGYRKRLRALLESHLPGAEVYDPLADHANSLKYDDEQGRRQERPDGIDRGHDHQGQGGEQDRVVARAADAERARVLGIEGQEQPAAALDRHRPEHQDGHRGGAHEVAFTHAEQRAEQQRVDLAGRLEDVGDQQRAGGQRAGQHQPDACRRVELTFTPRQLHQARPRLGLFYADTRQWFGRFDGVLRSPDGECVPVTNALGWLGSTRTRW